MEFLRPATVADASRIAEIIVTNYRTNFYPFFRDDAFYFGELNVVDMASEYTEDTQQLRNTYVYDDGIVKGIIRISGDAIEKLYVEPQFQGAADWRTPAEFCGSSKAGGMALGAGIQYKGNCFLSAAWISADRRENRRGRSGSAVEKWCMFQTSGFDASHRIRRKRRCWSASMRSRFRSRIKNDSRTTKRVQHQWLYPFSRMILEPAGAYFCSVPLESAFR